MTYNLGLAHGRSGEYEEAQIALKRILCDKNASVYKKALALSKRLQLCIDKGIPLFTNEVKNPEVESLEDAAEAQKNSTPTRWDEVMTKIEAKRGDVGCYLVFVSADPKDPKAEALYATPLPYTVRTVQKKMATEVSQQST